MSWPQVPSFQLRLCGLTGKLMLNGQLMCQVSTEWQIYASQLAKLFFKGQVGLPTAPKLRMRYDLQDTILYLLGK